jgi:hypothetical protein
LSKKNTALIVKVIRYGKPALTMYKLENCATPFDIVFDSALRGRRASPAAAGLEGVVVSDATAMNGPG